MFVAPLVQWDLGLGVSLVGDASHKLLMKAFNPYRLLLHIFYEVIHYYI